MEADREKAIEARAYQLWEETGHPHGMQDEHWRQAEREVDEAAAEGATDRQGGEDVASKPTDDVTSVSRQSADVGKGTRKRGK